MTKKSSVRRTRRVFQPEFRAKVALAALREDKTMVELCRQYELHLKLINDWKAKLLSRASEVFDTKAPDPFDVAPSNTKMGQQALELDFLNSALTQAGLLSASKSDLALMCMLDEMHLERPFMGSRQLAKQFRKRGHSVGRVHVRTLMQIIGVYESRRRTLGCQHLVRARQTHRHQVP